MHIEKVNISFCKWLLGVHKYSSNFGVLGELGRYPIVLDILQGAVKYWQNLQRKRTEKSLIHDCLCEAEVIDAMGSTSWISWMKLICNELNIKNLRDISTHEIKSKIRRPFEIFWRDTINKDSKLRTYQKVKDHFRYEDYLGQLKFCERRLITKLRISAHNLRIETGQHTRPVTPAEDRKCLECGSGEIEDEFHVTMKCRKYADMRLKTLKDISSECPLFPILDDWSKFYFMLNSSGQFIKHVAKLVAHIATTRETPRRSLS